MCISGGKKCLSLLIYICLSVCLSVCLSIYLCLSLFVYLSISLSTYLYLSIYQSISLSFCLSLYLSVFLSLCLSIYLSIYLSLPFCLGGGTEKMLEGDNFQTGGNLEGIYATQSLICSNIKFCIVHHVPFMQKKRYKKSPLVSQWMWDNLLA